MSRIHSLIAILSLIGVIFVVADNNACGSPTQTFALYNHTSTGQEVHCELSCLDLVTGDLKVLAGEDYVCPTRAVAVTENTVHWMGTMNQTFSDNYTSSTYYHSVGTILAFTPWALFTLHGQDNDTLYAVYLDETTTTPQHRVVALDFKGHVTHVLTILSLTPSFDPLQTAVAAVATQEGGTDVYLLLGWSPNVVARLAFDSTDVLVAQYEGSPVPASSFVLQQLFTMPTAMSHTAMGVCVDVASKQLTLCLVDPQFNVKALAEPFGPVGGTVTSVGVTKSGTVLVGVESEEKGTELYTLDGSGAVLGAPIKVPALIITFE